ncbi:MAG: cytochrome c oxidase assembly protein [Chloroflexi bacterium]|nr:cytochrome c oxidase assembly protein [Chloroflexota bacterium]
MPVAHAHEGTPPAPHDIWTAWNWEPAILLGLVLATYIYARGVAALWRRAGCGRGVRRWQTGAYVAGLLALSVALISPLNALGTALLSAHMVQHLAIILVAAPAIVLGAPIVPFLWALPEDTRRSLPGWWRRMPLMRVCWTLLSQPLVVWGLHTMVLWIWHLPTLYQAALRDEFVHGLEHASFLAAASLFWWTLVHTGARARLGGHGAGVLFVFTTAVQGSALGALMTFVRTPWYPAYAPSTLAWGLSPLEDQQIAGLIMWMPASFVYVAASIVLVVAWLQAAERRVTGSSATSRPWSGQPPPRDEAVTE